MAYIGLRHPVVAPITAETPGTGITYGTGRVLGKAIAANVTYNRPDNPLYADDSIAENDNGITDGTVEFNADDLTNDDRAAVLGLVALQSSGQSPAPTGVYRLTDAAAPYVGFGYLRVRRKSGATTFEAFWFYKVQFAEESENAQTKGQQIEWGTPTLNGRFMGVQLDSSGAIAYRDNQLFTTEAAAVAWLDGLANIAAASSGSGSGSGNS